MGKVKVVVGLSGGVDSSVAALILKRAGFDVVGVYLKCYWTHEGCQSDLDRTSAARVASHLNIPFEVWDFEKEYREKVVEYFYGEHEAGRTPNPDVVCNREIKFGLFLRQALNGKSQITNDKQITRLKTQDEMKEHSRSLGDRLFLATGHYARIGMQIQDSRLKIKDREKEWVLPRFCQEDLIDATRGIKIVDVREYVDLIARNRGGGKAEAGIGGNFSIFGGVDVKKDQSYFLYDIDQEAIEHILFPLGNLTKGQVREIAKETDLPTSDRPDSTGICFIGEVNVKKFLKQRIKEHEGEVVDVAGRGLGRHKGVEFYTIGQRRGFEVYSEARAAQRSPLYVVDKEVKNNRLVVGAGEECKRDQFKIQNAKFKIKVGSGEPELFVRIRHLGEMTPCEVKVVNPRVSLSTAAADYRGRTSSADLSSEVKLAYPVFGVAPGQSAVFYQRLSAIGYRPSAKSDVAGGWRPEAESYLWRVAGGGIIQ